MECYLVILHAGLFIIYYIIIYYYVFSLFPANILELIQGAYI